MLWENLREEEFEGAIERCGGLCVIPIGCLEKHGQHLPVGTDYMEAMHLTSLAAELEEAVIFPLGAWFGEVSCFHSFKNPEKARLRGCIGIKQELLLALLSEICAEIARNGFKKILIVNGHGGNSPMLKHFIRMQSYEAKDYAVLSASAFAFRETEPKNLIKIIEQRPRDFENLTDGDMETLRRFAKTGTGGGPADVRETSLIFSYNESLVAPDRYDAESGISTAKTSHLERAGIDCPNLWLANFPNSYEAIAPHGASRAIGDAMAKVSAERLAKIFKLIKEDTACLEAAKLSAIAEL